MVKSQEVEAFELILAWRRHVHQYAAQDEQPVPSGGLLQIDGRASPAVEGWVVRCELAPWFGQTVG
jgi:siderophore synthetase component